MRGGADQLLGHLHHRGVIDIGLVELERGEFGVVPRRQPFVAKAAVDLEHLVGEPADHQPLQMQLGRDAQIEVDIERVVVGDEGLGRGAAGDRMQHRRLDFEIAARDEMAAQRGDDPAAPAQGLAALRVHDQIEVALAVAQLDIGETVKLLGQRAQGLGQDGEGGGVDRQLAARGAAHQPFDADQIADVEEPHRGEPGRIDEVAMAEHLDLAGGVVQVDEHAAVAHGADPAGDTHPLGGLGPGRQPGMAPFELGRLIGAGERIGIGVDPERLEPVELGQADIAQRILDVVHC